MGEGLSSVINVAIANLPGIIAAIRERHKEANPDTPALTDEEVMAALQSAIASSLAKDDAWRAAHPESPSGSDQ